MPCAYKAAGIYDLWAMSGLCGIWGGAHTGLKEAAAVTVDVAEGTKSHNCRIHVLADGETDWSTDILWPYDLRL